jgi:hypothetical protein
MNWQRIIKCMAGAVVFFATVGAAQAMHAVPTISESPAGQNALAPVLSDATLPHLDDQSLAHVMINHGNRLMRAGDAVAARRVYEKAAAVFVSPEVFVALGRSYDPSYFETLNVKTGTPDLGRAFDFYEKAGKGNNSKGKGDIYKLKKWLQAEELRKGLDR